MIPDMEVENTEHFSVGLADECGKCFLRLGGAFLAATVLCSAQITLAEYPIPTSNAQPEMIVQGPDGALWFPEFGGNKIGRITAAGTFTEYVIPTAGSGPFGIVVGPDGALWFTEYNAGKIGRMTTAGVVTNEYPVPSAHHARDLCVGPDGALWFSENSNSSVGRMTLAGAVNEYPTPGLGPSGITAGPDGGIWFVSQGTPTSYVGRLSAAGVLTSQYAIPSAYGYPVGITAGPDGALWFGALGNTIGRITTGGTITGFAISTGADVPVTGPDGAIWVTEHGKIARVTTTGVVTEYNIPSGNSAYYITPGLGGVLWFTEYAGGEIGMISGSSSVAARLFAHIADGGEWQTEFLLTNDSAMPLTARILFHLDGGQAALPIEGVGTVPKIDNIFIPAHGSAFYRSVGNPSSPLITGWAELFSTASLTGQATFRRHAADDKYYEGAIAVTVPTTSFTVPFDGGNFSGTPFYTGLAIANADSTKSATLTCSAYDSSGTLLGSNLQVAELGPSAHTATILQWTGPTVAVLGTSRGLLVCNASAAVGALGLRAFGTYAITSLPIVTH